ncbi:MAG: hypothetical protein NW226_18390 [Microscillaceae bacterium]|nr:hypothetical protein [Microscillaceae bacterium]
MCRIFYAFFMQFAFFLNPCFAQKEYNNWYFGDRASLNFQNGSPRVQMNSEMVVRGGFVSISDKNTGDLLFYANAGNVSDFSPPPVFFEFFCKFSSKTL